MTTTPSATVYACPSWWAGHDDSGQGWMVHERVIAVGDVELRLCEMTGERQPGDPEGPHVDPVPEYYWLAGDSILHDAEALRQSVRP